MECYRRQMPLLFFLKSDCFPKGVFRYLILKGNIVFREIVYIVYSTLLNEPCLKCYSHC